MRGEVYEPGEEVKIRDWDEMAEEYEVLGTTINCPSGFVREMRCLCGNSYVIKELTCENTNVDANNYSLIPHVNFWISGAMLKRAETPVEISSLDDIL